MRDFDALFGQIPDERPTKETVLVEPTKKEVPLQSRVVEDQKPLSYSSPDRSGIIEEAPPGEAPSDENEKIRIGAGAIAGGYAAKNLEHAAKAVAAGVPTKGSAPPVVPPMNVRVDAGSLQRYLNSQIPSNIRMPLSELEKIVGSKIRTMSEVQAALKAIQPAASEHLGKTTSINPATGMPRKIYSTTQGRPAVDLSMFEFKPTIANKIAENAQQGAEVVKRALPSMKTGIGALGGALSAKQLYDAYEQLEKEGPSLRNAAKWSSGVGGALGVLPFGITQAAGLALQGPEIGLDVYDWANKNLDRTPKTMQEIEEIPYNPQYNVFP